MLCFRHMTKTKIGIIGAVLLIAIAGTAQFFSPREAAAPAAPAPAAALELPPAATNAVAPALEVSTVSTGVSGNTLAAPSIAAGDVIASWSFKGAYADNAELMTKAGVEIARLLGLVGKETYTDLALYVAIANQYGLLGDGKQEYEYLGRAIKANTTSGLPWHNLGVLMEKLGALQTARTAYENATLIQPEMKNYQLAYINFLIARLPSDTATIEEAFAEALLNFHQDAELLALRSKWKGS